VKNGLDILAVFLQSALGAGDQLPNRSHTHCDLVCLCRIAHLVITPDPSAKNAWPGQRTRSLSAIAQTARRPAMSGNVNQENMPPSACPAHAFGQYASNAARSHSRRRDRALRIVSIWRRNAAYAIRYSICSMCTVVALLHQHHAMRDHRGWRHRPTNAQPATVFGKLPQ